MPAFKQTSLVILALNCVRVAQALNESNLGYPTPAEFLTKEWNLSSTEGSAKKCAACTAAVLKVSSEVLKQSTYDYLVPLATDICMLVAFDASTVCPGIIPMMATPVIDMIGRELFSKERICNEFLEVCAIPSFETITVEEYSTRVLAGKPEVIQNDDYVTNLYSQIYNDPNPRPTLRAIHISDPHIDLMYKVGSLANCPGYLCCREEWGYPTIPDYQAGQFGAGGCDLPVDTLDSMLKHIAETVKPDLFFWTGDNTSHNDWNNSVEEVADATLLITQMIKDAFQGQDIPIYPTLGNHDTWPVDVEDFSKPSSNYIINHVKDSWTDWIGADAVAKFGEWGYFSVPFKLPGGEVVNGSRVISLNTQVADSLNWYLPGIKNDPGDQIAWLEKELSEVEAAGGYAFIIGHIYPADFTEVWGGRYHALMERYQHVVRMGLFGHTHDEYFEVVRSGTNPSKNIGLNQIGPSVTTYTEKNPGYAVLEIDQQTMLPTNILIYALDIKKANAEGVANWELVTDYVNDYKMTEMSPNGLYDLASRFKTDMKLLSLYEWGRSRHYGHRPIEVTPDQGFEEFCSRVSTTRYEYDDCIGDPHKSKAGFLDDPVGYAFNYLMGDWKVKAQKTDLN